MRTSLVVLAISGAVGLVAGSTDPAESFPELNEIRVPNSIDGSEQPSLLWTPEAARSEPTPLLVCLHTWSHNYKQDRGAWRKEAVERGWIFLKPNFRGRNDKPQACGSHLARQDILDAIDDVLKHYEVDTSRIYLAGVSGGGHMSMLMAGYHPHRFSAVSAWVGISDLAAWYRFHTKDGKEGRYARMVAACCGGPPGASPEVAAEYRERSPLFHLHRVGDLPLDLNAGVNDGHTGSVPVRHTLRAFNVIAEAGGHATVSEKEMQELWTNRRLSDPQASDTRRDPAYGRAIRLRRHAGEARVTIFEGGHEGLPHAACAWLARQKRPTRARLETSRPRP